MDQPNKYISIDTSKTESLKSTETDSIEPKEPQSLMLVYGEQSNIIDLI